MDDGDEVPAARGNGLISLHDRRDDTGASLRSVLALITIWVVTAGVAFWLGDGLAARFLDLPLSAYLAGQGALMAAVAVSVRFMLLTESAPAR